MFVHGYGCNAGWWMTTIWRFESNGWPRERLFAVNIPYPAASAEYDKPQEGRSSTVEQTQFLAAEVDKALKATGASKVVLIGHSRGGNAIRYYIANGGGDKTVSHAILGAAPNHGGFVNPTKFLGSEFNGSGRFVTALNAPKGPTGDEATPGVSWMTIRSDNNDLYYQTHRRRRQAHQPDDSESRAQGCNQQGHAWLRSQRDYVSPAVVCTDLRLHHQQGACNDGNRHRGSGDP